MVLKIGIDQVPRHEFVFNNHEDGLVSANYVNKGEPYGTERRYHDKNEWAFGFNDFVIAELTPRMAYSVTGNLQENQAREAPEHVRAQRDRTPPNSYGQGMYGYADITRIGAKNRSGYTTIAYGWGNKDDIFDVNVESEYINVREPGKASELTGEPMVWLVALPIPGGLAKWDTFWIDLNKGVRALYFPARYVYNKDFPHDAAYAKVSFVEQGSRKLIDAAPLMFETSLAKLFGGPGVDLAELTRESATTIGLQSAQHVGAYSLEKSIIVNIPKFIEQSYLVATNQKASPHDAIYLADSKDISAKPRTPSDDWKWPQDYFWASVVKTVYAEYLSRTEQMNLIEQTTSDLGMGGELALTVLCMAASLVPYVGPFLATAGSIAIEKLKNVESTSPAEDFTLVAASDKTWNSIPGEAKERLVKGIKSALNVLQKAKRL
ncbi:hypothetical protein CNMCM8980_002374 [Aspergillus fumigatiaffinis]|nr:hypothetical protein CNMCM8980_002374 [Aspergillus fumigatiaffinis]